MSKLLPTFEEMDVNEASNHLYFTSKRKYKDTPAEYVSSNAPIRNNFLNFVGSSGKVTEEEMETFLNSLIEEQGVKRSREWLKNNSHLVDSKIENGEKIYKLTKRGDRIFSINRKFESIKGQLKDEAKKDLIASLSKVDFEKILAEDSDVDEIMNDKN